MGYLDYFLIVEDYVNYCKNNSIPVGPGRGSSAGSLVSYLLNITEVDSCKYDLLFERLTPDSIKFEETVEEESVKAIEFKQAELITIDDFAKVQFKVGLVVECEAVPKSKLLHSNVRVGTKTLSILSGIGKVYTPEQLVGKKVVVVTNLPPREMKGLVSEGMIICAEDEQGNLSLISPEKYSIPDGSNIS